MDYKYLENAFENDDFMLPPSGRIDSFLFKNNQSEIHKAIDFFKTNEKFLYIHGFLGTGKRQFINYLSVLLSREVILLEYYCKPSTVCDDILLSFINTIEKNPLSKAVNHSVKVTTLMVKFQKYVSSIKKPFVIILHSFDDVTQANMDLIVSAINNVLQNTNVKVIVSTRAMLQNLLSEHKYDKKISLKPFSKELFREFIEFNDINCTEDAINDFYKYSRGYYYYTILTIKIIQAMKISLNDFLTKFVMSGMSFDAFLGFTYINLIPNTIRNFFWFLRTLRHGVNINTLAILGLYDEASLDYLKKNLMIFVSNETIYVQDYFQQDIDISIPIKVEIKLHKYIIGIYEKELKESLQTRTLLMSRQALRAEIEYHSQKIYELEHNSSTKNNTLELPSKSSVTHQKNAKTIEKISENSSKMQQIKDFKENRQYTDAIELIQKIIEQESPDANTLAELRVELGRLYKIINEFSKAQHYYELAAKYYEKKSEFINLNYLFYELTGLYYDMYKLDKAVDTIKKVIYSVDTPQSLMVDACTLLGNIFSNIKKSEEASKYYQKALESIDETAHPDGLAELYFKYALMCDEQDNKATAFEYYNKCILLKDDSQYKALAYSNIASCYLENENYSDAEACFLKAYDIDKKNNNYEGIYYNSSNLAKIYLKINPKKALTYLIEAKQGAEFINEEFYILETTVALGDFYYDHKDKYKLALIEYCKALNIAKSYGDTVDITKIEERIKDMKIRIDSTVFEQVIKNYG